MHMEKISAVDRSFLTVHGENGRYRESVVLVLVIGLSICLYASENAMNPAKKTVTDFRYEQPHEGVLYGYGIGQRTTLYIRVLCSMLRRYCAVLEPDAVAHRTQLIADMSAQPY